MRTLQGQEQDCDISRLSSFLGPAFKFSSRKDRLVEIVRESLAKCLWSSYFWKPDTLPDEKRFEVLELLLAITCPENKVLVALF